MRIRPGHIIGAGLGGFLDGIVLHQILQWHNMGSAVLAPLTMDAMHQNMLWDGLFHAAMWLLTVVGVCWLWAEAEKPGRLPSHLSGLLGQFLVGWGVFNLVEGGIDHHLLHLHHVRDLPTHVPAYDWTFLVVGGVGITLVGWLLSSRDARVPLSN